MVTGDNPAAVYCRICGYLTIPLYPGYKRDAVCSDKCFKEFEWRTTLYILGKPYRPQNSPESEIQIRDPRDVAFEKDQEEAKRVWDSQMKEARDRWYTDGLPR